MGGKREIGRQLATELLSVEPFRMAVMNDRFQLEGKLPVSRIELKRMSRGSRSELPHRRRSSLVSKNGPLDFRALICRKLDNMSSAEMVVEVAAGETGVTGGTGEVGDLWPEQ